MKHLISTFSAAKDAYFKHLRLLSIPIVIDLSSFIAAIYLFYTFYLKVIEHLVTLVQIGEERGQQAMNALTASEFSNVMSRQAEFMQHYNTVINLFLMYAAIGYLLYVVTQGINWYLTDMILHGKKADARDVLTYLWKFFLMNLIWLIGLFGILFVAVDVLFWNSQSQNPIFPQISLNIAVLVVLAAYFYFVFMSYTLLLKHKFADALKQTFVVAFSKNIALVYLILAILFFIISYLIKFSVEMSLPLGLVLIVALMMPFLTFGRVCLIKGLHQ